MRQWAGPDMMPAARTPPDTRIYAIGDIHGRKDLLDHLLELIAADAARSRARRRLVVFLGDYVDRGLQSRAVIETVRAGPPSLPEWERFRWIALRGNHEDLLLRFLDDIEVGQVWLAEGNGGMATLFSYIGKRIAQYRDAYSLQDAFRRSLPRPDRAFLEGLPPCHSEGDYFFVHAGVRPGVPLGLQASDDLLWIRGEFLTSNADFGKIVVHGHSISRVPQERRNRIGIDTGAFMTNHLTALVAEGDWHGFLST